MKQQATSFWNEVQRALADYGQAFLHTLPRLTFALLVPNQVNNLPGI